MHWIRFERQRRLVVTACLAFTVGALTARALIWRVDRLEARTSVDDLAYLVSAETPAATTPAAASGTPAVVDLLKSRRLDVPVEGISRDQLRDSFDERRAGGLRKHEAIDIMAARGTKVTAVESGRVAKLFTSIPGGLTAYVFDPSETFVYYYAHLDRYASGLSEGEPVRRGDLIGYVGSTGNASEDAPHLHFAILQVGTNRKWWQGDPINPYDVLR